MAALNIDASLVEKHALVQKEEKIVKLQNGCICCTLREDLLEEVARLAKDGAFDYLIIESTGISEPMQVAETFTTEFYDTLADQGDDQSPSMAALLQAGGLVKLARLDTCVTVVRTHSHDSMQIDCVHFFDNFETAEMLVDRYANEAEEQDERTITVNLLPPTFNDRI
jgi:G3E family GTPase